MTNTTINLIEIPKQILSINLPTKQKYTALKPLFTAAFKAGCQHFNIKYHNSGNDQNIIEFVKLINEWSNKEFFIENQSSPRENKNIFISLTLIINNNLNETLSTDIEELLNHPNLNYKQPKKKAKIDENNKNIIINIRSSIKRKDNYLAKNYPLKFWNSLEKYLTSGNLKDFGICGVDLDKIENVYNGALIKPKYWQITLNQLLEYFEEIKNLANKLNLLIIVDTTGGVGECKINGTMRINLLRDLSKKYERTASQVLHRWLIQHGMIIQRNCGTLNYLNISRQISISDIEISEEDMNSLNELYKRKAQEQIKSVIEKNGNGFHSSRHLMGQRRLAGDLALGLALIGISLMIIAHECANLNYKIFEKTAKIGLIISTFTLLLATLNFHWIDIKTYMYQNSIPNWQTVLTQHVKMKIILELIVCSICPLPGLEWPTIDTFLSSLMFLRLYWVTRCLHLHSRLSYDVAAKSIAGMNRVKTDTKFILKRTLYLYPGLALAIFVLVFWLIGGYILRLCEGNFGDENLRSYYNALWLMCVTFLTIGYGDVYPITVCGRLMAILTGVIGVCVASMIVAVISQKISLSHAEERVHNFMARTKHARSLKITAAQVLKECWFLYKIKSMADQDKVIQHQRRLSAAICTLRRLRKEQRVLQEENGVSLDDVAKISQNATEMIRGVGQSQQRLTERVNAMELRLEQIHKGIDVLTELIIKRNETVGNETKIENKVENV